MRPSDGEAQSHREPEIPRENPNKLERAPHRGSEEASIFSSPQPVRKSNFRLNDNTNNNHNNIY